jgi:hypothetical protein
MTTSATTVTAAGTSTSTGTRLAAVLDRKLADTEQALLDVADWYYKAWLATMMSFGKKSRSANETAALWLGVGGFKSEAEIGTRPCKCADCRGDVCQCYTTLKAARVALAHAPIQEETPAAPAGEREPTREETAEFTDELNRQLADMMREVLRVRGAKVIPQHIDLWSALLFLAPLGNDLAQEVLGFALRARTPSEMIHDDTPLQERLFQDRRYVTLFYAAFATHPNYTDCESAPIIRRWQELGIAAIESAYLVDWFCATHPMRARRIERDLKIKMRKQGWHV